MGRHCIMHNTITFHAKFEDDESQLGKQVTRGHNIVADGWAGASNPDPHSNSHPTRKHSQKVSKTLVFPLFDSIITDGRTDGPTDQHGRTDRRTDKASYRVACPQLKRKKEKERKKDSKQANKQERKKGRKKERKKERKKKRKKE